MPKRRAKHKIVLFEIALDDPNSPVVAVETGDVVELHPNLPSDWRELVTRAAPDTLNDAQEDIIRRAVSEYIFVRWIEINRIPYGVGGSKRIQQDTSYFGALEDVGRALKRLSSFEGGSIRHFVLEEICEVDPALDFDETLKVLSNLHERARVLWLEHKRRSEAKPEQSSSFIHLIQKLKTVFEIVGWKATAAKSSRAKEPKPSDFVRFVYVIMRSLPPSIQEHSQSEAAMAKAISPIIARRQTSRILRDGKRSNSPRKSPATSR